MQFCYAKTIEVKILNTTIKRTLPNLHFVVWFYSFVIYLSKILILSQEGANTKPQVILPRGTCSRGGSFWRSIKYFHNTRKRPLATTTVITCWLILGTLPFKRLTKRAQFLNVHAHKKNAPLLFGQTVSHSSGSQKAPQHQEQHPGERSAQTHLRRSSLRFRSQSATTR